MQKIKDERLILKNLKNIRIAFIVQTVGILILLTIDFINEGKSEMISNPLWIVFMTTMVILTLLSININIEYEKSNEGFKKKFTISMIILIIISLVIGVLVAFTPGYHLISGVIAGLILFICGSLSLIYVYWAKKKADEI